MGPPLLASRPTRPKPITETVAPVHHEHRTNFTVRPEFVEGQITQRDRLVVRASFWPTRQSRHLATSHSETNSISLRESPEDTILWQGAWAMCPHLEIHPGRVGGHKQLAFLEIII